MNPLRLSIAPAKHPILARVIVYGAAVCTALPWGFSSLILSPHRNPPGPTRKGVQELRIPSDGLGLRAWLNRAATEDRPAVVMVHGLGDVLENYEDLALVLKKRGYTSLLVDTRAQGGSEGKYLTLGALEKDDVRAAMRELRVRGLAKNGIVLMGWSMGASAVLLAALGQRDIRAIVAEAPYDTFRHTVAHHAELLLHIPGWLPLIPVAIAVAEWRAGFDADAADCVAAARRIEAPLFLIADGADDRMPEPVVRKIYDAHHGPNDFWVVQNAPHAGAILASSYESRVIAFLERYAGAGAEKSS